MALTMQCNICGGDRWEDFNRRIGIHCQDCGSLERTRLFWLYLDALNLGPDTKILHLAPEKGLYHHLKARFGDNYVVADINPSLYGFAPDCRYIDLTTLDDWPAESFDLIMHLHVLEHVPCNLAYPLFHLHRMLKPDGKHLCIIPFFSGSYDECFAEIGDDERNRRFGQKDHVRRIGREDIEKHLGSLLNFPADFDARRDFSEARLTACNIPKSFWQGFHGATVLNLKKSDYRLQ